MADYRRFQPHRETTPFNWRLVVIIGGVVVVLIVVGILAFGRHGSDNKTDDGPSIALINDASGSTNGNVNAAATNGNVNAETNSNSNTNTAVVASGDNQAILSACPGAVSQMGEAAKVALTFDIVADNDNVTKLLTALTTAKIPAVFFVTGNYAKDHGELLRRINTAGFAVYSRGTATSKKYATMDAAAVAADLENADLSIGAATGHSTKPFFRPPQGATSTAATAAAHTAGYCTVTWTVDANDWSDDQTVAGAVTRVLEKAKAGAIIMMGAGNDITADVVANLATEIPKKSLKFAVLSDLFQP